MLYTHDEQWTTSDQDAAAQRQTSRGVLPIWASPSGGRPAPDERRLNGPYEAWFRCWSASH